MTEDEKANDIYDICLEKKSIYCNRKMGDETCSKCKTYQMYKLGLEKGERIGKEKQWIATEKSQKKTSAKIEQLEKDNEELKVQVEKLTGSTFLWRKAVENYKEKIARLKAEINQIIEREKVVPEHYLCEMIEKNKELKEENEQLKCDLYNTEANLQGMTINCENLEKENEQLKAKIKKMICCSNCKNVHYDWREQIFEGVCTKCIKYNKWELNYD